MRFAHVIATPIGLLTLVEEDEKLTEIRFGERLEGESRQASSLLLQAESELEEYFMGRRQRFTLPLAPKGTPFQKRCWQALCDIPYGETRTYAQQAAMIGHAKACRAVGMSNHRNPIPIVIPCHRVIGAHGRLTGYAAGLTIKQTLLALERMHSR